MSRHNNGMQRPALRAAADAKRYPDQASKIGDADRRRETCLTASSATRRRTRSLRDSSRAHLRAHGLDVFLASVSLQPGERWSEATWVNLKPSP